MEPPASEPRLSSTESEGENLGQSETAHLPVWAAVAYWGRNSFIQLPIRTPPIFSFLKACAQSLEKSSMGSAMPASLICFKKVKISVKAGLVVSWNDWLPWS